MKGNSGKMYKKTKNEKNEQMRESKRWRGSNPEKVGAQRVGTRWWGLGGVGSQHFVLFFLSGGGPAEERSTASRSGGGRSCGGAVLLQRGLSGNFLIFLISPQKKQKSKKSISENKLANIRKIPKNK